MSPTQEIVQVALRYDGKVFVLDQPFPHLPPGTVIHVWTATKPTDWPPGYLESTMGQGPDLADPEDPPAVLRPKKPVANQAEWVAFLDRIEDAWIGPDMDDPDDPPPKEPDF